MAEVRTIRQPDWHEIRVGDPFENCWLQYRDGYFVAVSGSNTPSSVWIAVDLPELREAINKLLDAAEAE